MSVASRIEASQRFARFVQDERLRPPHVARAVVSLASALLEASTLARADVDGVAARARADFDDAPYAVDVARFERRQLALAALYFDYARRMDERRFGSIDLGVHLGALEALVRYESAWTAVGERRRRFGASTTPVDFEQLDSALSTCVATLALAYGGGGDRSTGDYDTLQYTGASLNSVLGAAATLGSAVPSRRVRDLARCLRIVILQRMQFSLSDAAFAVRVAVGGGGDDRKTAAARRRVVVAAGVETAAALVDLLVVGRPRIERSLERLAPVALDASVAVGEWLASSPLADAQTRERVRADASLAALATPLWLVLVVVSCVRVTAVIQRAADASLADRSHFSHIARAVFGDVGGGRQNRTIAPAVGRADFAQQLAAAALDAH